MKTGVVVVFAPVLCEVTTRVPPFWPSQMVLATGSCPHSRKCQVLIAGDVVVIALACVPGLFSRDHWKRSSSK